MEANAEHRTSNAERPMAGSTVSPFQGPEPPGGAGLVIQYALDRAPKPISATLDFVVPNVDPTITGNTVGQSITFLGFISLQNGAVTWDGPAIVNIPGDRSFQVTLSDEIFNFGIFGLFPGQHKGASVEATIQQLTSVSGVPDSGSTALLFGAALAGIFGLRFRRVWC